MSIYKKTGLLLAMFYMNSSWAAYQVDIQRTITYDGIYYRAHGFLFDWFGDDPTSNPCYRKSCDLGMQLHSFNPITGAVGGPIGSASYFVSNPPWLSSASSLGEVGKGIRGILPIERLLMQTTSNTLPELVAVCLVYRSGGVSQKYADLCGFSGEGPKDKPVWCEPRSGAVSLNYGPINSEELDGKTKSSPYIVWCNRDVTAKIYVKGLTNGRLYLRGDQSLYADLTINAKELSSGLTQSFREGREETFTIQSTLGSAGAVVPGDFRGSTVVYVDIL
ncbi:MrpH family fimbial adhesin [Serratia nevei]|uniref:MrpH family fimbial adhesin n=1 Tax=Serratia TaxID=613 RepID=UPI0018D76863|nr:hypothetical protein [Serratia marcescens]MBH2871187.1 hypothetical protein [Serratia marcescens]MBI6126334.1 hypothetical protein [Serratia marcescens]MBN5185112.1 hypothetical protein [Serratia marcescens]MBN5194908.1 hypothetical protein [Serratia marcescens]MBN5301071.1 hypothetical protein [Serratia marcescens]